VNENQARPYDKSVDFWSLGVMVFNLLTGHAPFTGNNRKKVSEKILKGKFTCPAYFSPYAKDLCIRVCYFPLLQLLKCGTTNKL
jgi:serine/threonine protein kinase